MAAVAYPDAPTGGETPDTPYGSSIASTMSTTRDASCGLKARGFNPHGSPLASKATDREYQHSLPFVRGAKQAASLERCLDVPKRTEVCHHMIA